MPATADTTPGRFHQLPQGSIGELSPGTLGRLTVPKVQAIPTSVRRGEPPIYRELAEAAHAAGFPKVSASQVHEWVVDGLLPPTADQRSHGRHGFVSERREAVAEQLLALCRHRTQTKSRDRLAMLLWLDGWPIPTDRLRRAVLRRWPDPARVPIDLRTERGLDVLDRFARNFGPAILRDAGLVGLRSDDAANATYDAVGVAVGAFGIDDEAAAQLQKILAIDPALTQTRPDPRSPDVSGLLVRCRRLVQEASADDLETARPRARRLAIELPLLGRAVGLTTRRDLGGLRLLISGFVTPEMAVGLALFYASTELGPRLDRLLPAPPLPQP